ncbi:MAG: dksa/trar family transcriptional regulator [Thermoleophilia bacterium]|nr:dksa/trar family transcriptional regulator [Thermoleophilia bacterium]
MDADRAAQLLAAERERIEQHLTRLRGEMPSDAVIDDTDQGDLAYDMNERERDAARITELEDELRALERAEARLAAGTYGLSVESGEPISDARLERLPAAERTADEQRLWERSGR